MSNTLDITLYLVGYDADRAVENFPFDSEESANSYRDDNPGMQVFEVDAKIDFSTIRPA